MIIRNAAECRKCGDIVESTHRWDYQTCSCGAIAVDGGKDYLRRAAKDPHDIIDRSEVEDEG